MNPPRRARTIAVVDDDRAVRRALERLLRYCGYTVRCYCSASEFLGSSGPGEVDCLVLDVQMQGSNGFELDATLKTRGVHLPVVYMTAHDTTQAREQASLAKGFGFLVKPFRRQDLLIALDHALPPE